MEQDIRLMRIIIEDTYQTGRMKYQVRGYNGLVVYIFP
jgi:hypothetical protein